MRLGLAVPLLATFAACAGPESRPVGPVADESVLDAIAQREAERDYDAEGFAESLANGNAHVRSRAARALGRIADPRAVGLLVAAAQIDIDAKGVLEEIAFALGQIRSVEGFEALSRLCRHDSARVRRAAIEAIGKLPIPAGTDLRSGAIECVLAALVDSDPQVQGSASLATWRLDLREGVPHLSRLLEGGTASELRWRVAYALARIEDPATLPPLRRATRDPNPWVRTFAARGLRHPPDGESVPSLQAVLADPQSFWTARVEALRSLTAIAKRAREATAETAGAEKRLEVLAKIRESFIQHLAREKNPLATEALLAAIAEAGGVSAPALLSVLDRRDPTLRGEALVAIAQLDPDVARELLPRFANEDDPRLRGAAARALGWLGADELEPLGALLADRDPRVRAEVVLSLERVGGERGWDLIRDATEDPEISVRGSAVEAFCRMRPEGWAETLIATYSASTDPRYWEIRERILAALSEHSQAAASPLAEEALKDPSRAVRRRASAILGVPATGATPPLAAPRIRPQEILDRGNPWLHLETEKGAILIELFLAEAPLHVASIVDLARRGFYDGLTIHRVVPSFVVQGGDPTGTGWGDAGYQLPDEINPMPYLRGSVGMPKAGDDTGGCQFFITHLPTPRLDGRYTVFGRVAMGMEVVDRLGVGDRILECRVDENRFRPRSQLEDMSGGARR